MTKRIILAKMVDMGNGLRRRVGNEERDVSNEATQLAWQLVMAKGGEVSWDLDDGSRMVMRAEKLPVPVAIMDKSPAEIDSQRDANADLTTLLEQQEIKLADREKDIIRLTTALRQTCVERNALREELMSKPVTTKTTYRAAADIYYQLIDEHGIPEGCSLVTYLEQMITMANFLINAFYAEDPEIETHIIALGNALDATNQRKN